MTRQSLTRQVEVGGRNGEGPDGSPVRGPDGAGGAGFHGRGGFSWRSLTWADNDWLVMVTRRKPTCLQ